MPSTAGFTDASQPKPVLLAPKGSTPIVSGIAVSMQNDNQGAVGVKWMAAPGSFMDDVTINCSRTRTGTELLYGLWIADGGAGTFKGIWTPSESATAGLIVMDTSPRAPCIRCRSSTTESRDRSEKTSVTGRSTRYRRKR